MKIPARIRIKRGVHYEIVWQSEIASDPDCAGLCDPNTRTIYLLIGMSETETIKTLIHEVTHALEAEWGEKIPHRLVYVLEEAVYKLLKLNKWL
jgi:hypothetical protein